MNNLSIAIEKYNRMYTNLEINNKGHIICVINYGKLILKKNKKLTEIKTSILNLENMLANLD